MKDVTLVLPIKGGKILLGNKKRGFGKGKLTGFGGKLNEGENIEDAAIRESFEEIGIKINPDCLKKVAELYYFFPNQPANSWDLTSHVFLIDNWTNEPKESDEIDCSWFNIKDIPFDKMWDDSIYWLPLILSGKKIRANFYFDESNNKVKKSEIYELK